MKFLNNARVRHIFIIIFLFLWSAAIRAQQEFVIQAENSETYVDIESGLSRILRILDTNDRLIIIDYEAYRIFFYQKGTDFTDDQLLKVVGEYSRVQSDQPFDTLYHNRLSEEFTGTIFNDTLWITNYTYGEIIQFDLDGNYIKTLPGKFRILDFDNSTLYGFDGNEIYRFDATAENFIFLKNLPPSFYARGERHNGNIKIGYDRLCLRNYDSLAVYNLSDYLASDNPTILFSQHISNIPDFEILPDKILWATDYYGNYQYCDLDGNNLHSGKFSGYLTSFHYNGYQFYFVQHNSLDAYDTNLSLLSSISRTFVYVDARFLGADLDYIYFYDHHDGGFRLAPLNESEGTYLWDTDYEIPYSGWHYSLRLHDDYRFLLSEWPPDTFKIYRFNIDSLSSYSFEVEKIQGFDVVGDTLVAISGKNLKYYDLNGILLNAITLTHLTGSNLENIDSTSELLFAANKDHVLIGFDDKLNAFDHSGEFQSIFNFNFSYLRSYELFAIKNYAIYTSPLQYLDLNTGNVESLFDEDIRGGGYIWSDRYWYSPRKNQYNYKFIEKISTDIFHDDNNYMPEEFNLSQNYPNPFNPITLIKYQLPMNSDVEISIYNLLGQNVTTLVNERQNAGTYQVTWDASAFASGIYFYRIEVGDPLGRTGEFQDVKKMILIR